MNESPAFRNLESKVKRLEAKVASLEDAVHALTRPKRQDANMSKTRRFDDEEPEIVGRPALAYHILHDRDVYDSIAKNLKRIRESKGLAIGDVANLLGGDQELIEAIENKSQTPGIALIVRLTLALDVSITDLALNPHDSRFAGKLG